jgi:hypothetical protein
LRWLGFYGIARRRVDLDELTADRLWQEIGDRSDAKPVMRNLIALADQAGIIEKPTVVEYRRRPQTPAKLRALVLARDGCACRHCGATTNLHVDHIKPRAKGGHDDLDNLQILCQRCNSAKRDLTGRRARRAMNAALAVSRQPEDQP